MVFKKARAHLRELFVQAFLFWTGRQHHDRPYSGFTDSSKYSSGHQLYGSLDNNADSRSLPADDEDINRSSNLDNSLVMDHATGMGLNGSKDTCSSGTNFQTWGTDHDHTPSASASEHNQGLGQGRRFEIGDTICTASNCFFAPNSPAIITTYKIKDHLGEGSFGSVMAVVDDNDKLFALKCQDDDEYLLFKQEVKSLLLLDHPSIVPLTTAFETDGLCIIVMELASAGDLDSFIRNSRDGRLEEHIVKQFVHQLASGLKHCHDRGVVHTDIKTQNILVHSHGQGGPTAKITDFGLSLTLPDANDDQLYIMAGTPYYRPPETNLHHGYGGKKADIWALGIVMFKMLYGYTPHLWKDDDQHGHGVSDDTSSLFNHDIFPGGHIHTPTAPSVSNQCKVLLKKMLCVDPAKRASIDDILNHCYFSIIKLGLL